MIALHSNAACPLGGALQFGWECLKLRALTLMIDEFPTNMPRTAIRFPPLFGDALGKRKLSLTRSKSSRFPVYRVGMHGMTPDEIAMLAVAVFIAGFVAIAVWLLQR